jgi:uncharacterized protein (TIGR03435 family)
MLQALLADRFKLVVREDTRPTLTSALTVAGSAHKMRTASGGTPNCQPQPQPAALTMTLVCRNMTMAGFADLLPQAGRGYVQGPVADATNIAGGWDFELSWTPMQVMSQAGADGVSILKALDAQLGLKVEQKSVPVTALFVDSVSRTPTPNVSGARSQIPARPSQAFDVAVIKPSVDGSIPSTRLLPTGEINAVANSIRTLLAVAWDIPDESQILGPRWMDDARFDLVARISDRPADPQQVDNIAVAQMLKNLLVERFRITAHMEDRPMPAFTLTSSSAVKLTKADPALRTRCFDGPPPGVADPRTTNPVLSRLTTCQNITMGEFAERLPGIGAGYVRTPVADATGLEGRWTFSVAFSAPAMVQGARAGGTRSADGLTAPDPNGALSLEEALQRQLGLKLEARERPVSVLVIDTIDQEPRAN